MPFGEGVETGRLVVEPCMLFCSSVVSAADVEKANHVRAEMKGLLEGCDAVSKKIAALPLSDQSRRKPAQHIKVCGVGVSVCSSICCLALWLVQCFLGVEKFILDHYISSTDTISPQSSQLPQAEAVRNNIRRAAILYIQVSVCRFDMTHVASLEVA
jgi:hypothetical protein